MEVMKSDETPAEQVKAGLKRRIIHGKHLMSVILDFSNGPWQEAEPPHSHSHEQTTYVAEGEILFVCEAEQQHLKAGDAAFVPSGKKHSIQLLTEKARLIDHFTPLREDFL